MNIFKSITLVFILCAAAMLAGSCKKPGKNPPAGSEAARKKKAAVPKKTFEQFMKEMPCDLENKYGIFAVFPKNPVAGQWCFTLTPLEVDDTSKPGTTFDIQSNDLLIVLHQAKSTDPKVIKLLRRERRDNKACMEQECASPVETSYQSFADPKKEGMAYYFITPIEPIDFTSNTNAFYGISVVVPDGLKAHIPMFN